MGERHFGMRVWEPIESRVLCVWLNLLHRLDKQTFPLMHLLLYLFGQYFSIHSTAHYFT